MPRLELGLWRRATGARTNGQGKAGGREGVPGGRTSAGNGAVWEISERSSGGSHPSGHGRRWLAPRRGPRPTRTGGS